MRIKFHRKVIISRRNSLTEKLHFTLHTECYINRIIYYIRINVACVPMRSFQDGILIENMHDIPYVRRKDLSPEIVSTMTRICTEVKKITPRSIACGIQVYDQVSKFFFPRRMSHCSIFPLDPRGM